MRELLTSKRINILYIIDIMDGVGGTERHLSHLVLNLPKDLFNCSVVAFDLGPNILVDRMRGAGIPVIHLPVGREYTLNAMKRAVELYRYIKTNNIDIVQTYHQKSDTFGALVAKWSGVKHIVSSKRDMGQYRKIWHIALNKTISNIFEKVIVVADAVGEMIHSKEGTPHTKIVKIYNGVDSAEFCLPTIAQRIAARERLGFGPDDFVIGMVANFRKEKNHDIFFEGAAQAFEAIPSLKIIAVGGGPLLEQFRTRYANNETGFRIVFPGAVTDVVKYLWAMNVACLIPGTNEGFSNSVIEKMAVGLPLIVTDVGGNAEAVIDHENGFIIKPNDVAAFTDALIAMHSDMQMRKHMGSKSRKFVEEKFSLQAMCRAHETLYQKLAADDTYYTGKPIDNKVMFL
jgi:glycosyltransferase involved in cell wall biosynthesis